MLVIPTPESIYRGNYASLPANTLKPPIESNRTVPIEINWLAAGLAPQYTIHFNARQQQTLPISQIASLHIDNSQASSSMHVAFPDTQFEVIVGPNTVGFYPVVTNSLEFWCWIDKTPLAQDKTIIQVLNFLPPPIFFTTQPGGTGVGTVREVDTVAPLQGGPITDIGTISLATPLALNFGGTGSATAGGALDNLSGASGATAGTLVRAAGTPGVWSVAAGLSSPISVSNGGTGLTSLAPGNRMLVSNGTGNVIVSGITSDNGVTLSVSTNQVIGTATPGAPSPGLTINTAASAPLVAVPAGTALSVIGDAGNEAQLFVDAYNTTPGLVTRRARGTAAAPTAVQSGDLLNMIAGGGRGATGYSPAATQLAMAASENWSDTAQGSLIQFSTTQATTLTSAIRMSLRQGLTVGTNPNINPDPGPGALTLNANTVAPPANGTFAAPSLEILGATNGLTALCLDSFGNPGGTYINGRRARGTPGSPAAVQNTDALLLLAAQGHDGTGYDAFTHCMIDMAASENWTTSAHGSSITFATTPNGTTSGVNSLQLQGNAAVFSGTVTVPGVFYFGAAPAASAANMSATASDVFFHPPAGGGGYFFQNTGASVNLLWLDNGGNITISGATAVKASGTTWANPSSRDLKENIQPYDKGLQAILALQPRTYSFAADSGIDAPSGSPGGEHIGLVHDETAHMPELHRKLSIGSGDEVREVDGLDCSAITFALVNACKELAAAHDELRQRLVALEAKGTA